MWSEIILDPREVPDKNLTDNPGDNIDGFVRRLAAIINSDIKRAGHLFSFPLD